MEPEVKEEFIDQSKAVLKGKEGKDFEETPLDEARRLNEENKKLAVELREERNKLEKLQANLLIGGKTLAGQNVVEEKPIEKARRLGKEAVDKFFKK